MKFFALLASLTVTSASSKGNKNAIECTTDEIAVIQGLITGEITEKSKCFKCIEIVKKITQDCQKESNGNPTDLSSCLLKSADKHPGCYSAPSGSKAATSENQESA